MKLEFWKYEGLGNDFIVVDTRRWLSDERNAIGLETARRLCDRHFGIGADGVLRVDPAHGAGVARMTVLNADGSEAEMCGNGLRCFARFLADSATPHEAGTTLGRSFTVETGAGPLLCRLDTDTVEVALGAVVDGGLEALTLDGQALVGRRLTLGNPHWVLRGDHGRDAAARFGPAAQSHPRFPGGVKVSCRRFTGPATAELHVYERGCGLTLACGTGAGATAAAAWLDGEVAWGTAVRLRLPGGDLTISGDLSGLWLRGPARAVFQGVLTI